MPIKRCFSSAVCEFLAICRGPRTRGLRKRNDTIRRASNGGWASEGGRAWDEARTSVVTAARVHASPSPAHPTVPAPSFPPDPKPGTETRQRQTRSHLRYPAQLLLQATCDLPPTHAHRPRLLCAISLAIFARRLPLHLPLPDAQVDRSTRRAWACTLPPSSVQRFPGR
ncbi:hypothetical protein B0H17DRAFT_1027571 [Mycena rosella]|uniref:Uncharacterized protein n=1 Tax=Mycena rosella TaxID=1033263 RepID=A0AAD7H311_MYCRO|nr:hypothetical protein B0H17DRAFT_1027571 [Mycena rosella]